MRVCMGGTFDKLHRGHEALLSKAFEFGTHVFIGVTSDPLARHGRERRVGSYATRERNLRRVLREKGWLSRTTVERIDHPYGRALEGEYDAIVVSSETRATAEELNRDRAKAGRHALSILEVPHVLAADGVPISATRLARGEVDAEGRLLSATIAVGSGNPAKIAAVRAVAKRTFRKATVRSEPVSTGVPNQPIDGEIVQGAVNRAKSALVAFPKSNLGVGIEAGLLWDPGARQHHDVQYCAIVDCAGRVTIGHGPGFAHPPVVLDAVKRGKTVGDAIEEVSGMRGIGRRQGAIGYLSRGAMDRSKLTEAAILMALLPRLQPAPYEM